MQKGTVDELKMSQTSHINYGYVCKQNDTRLHDKPTIQENQVNTTQCPISQYEVDMDKLD